jgi:hypothetical protein
MEAVRTRLRERIGFDLLNEYFELQETQELRQRLPDGLNSFRGSLYLFEVEHHLDYWSIRDLRDDDSDYGQGWYPTKVRHKKKYRKEDVVALEEAVFHMNRWYLLTPLSALIDGFESVHEEDNNLR